MGTINILMMASSVSTLIIIYPLAVIPLLLLCNIKLFNPAIMVVISRLIHRMASIVSSHLSYKIYMYVGIIPEVNCHLSGATGRPA